MFGHDKGKCATSSAAKGLSQDRLVKFVPVVEIVEIHCVFGRFGIITNAAGPENTLSGFGIMIVAADGRVMSFNGLRMYRPGVFLHPFFELRISRLVLFDVVFDGLFVQAEGRTSHRIEAFADRWIARGKLASGFQRNLLPKPWQMENTKGTGNAGANQGNIGIAHASMLTKTTEDWNTEILGLHLELHSQGARARD